MQSAPRLSACSRKDLNLISALHSTSGLGVRPAWYSRRKWLNTRSLYSAEKLTASSSMPILSATARASRKSCLAGQCSSSSSSQFFMNRPSTSNPCCFSSRAATAESTPPDMPTITRLLAIRVRSAQPVVQREDRRRMAIVKEPGIHHERLLRAFFHDLRRPMFVHQQWRPPRWLQHSVESEPALFLQQAEVGGGVVRMVDAVHAPFNIAVVHVPALVAESRCLPAGHALQEANCPRDGVAFAVRVGHALKEVLHLGQVTLCQCDAGACCAAIVITDFDPLGMCGGAGQCQAGHCHQVLHRSARWLRMSRG